MVQGDHNNKGLAALQWGPFVLAYDAALNPALPSANLVGFANDKPARLNLTSGSLQVLADVNFQGQPAANPAVFVPFADAGASGGEYRVWLPAPGASINPNN